MPVVFELNYKGLIAWSVTLATAFGVGFAFARWIIYLDPDGTGGSILAMPVIMVTTVLSLVSLILGICTCYHPIGRKISAIGVLVWIFLFVGLGLLR